MDFVNITGFYCLLTCLFLCVHLELEQKLQEERSSKLRVENRVLELEKKNSMLDCDYKQSLQKLEELRRHKERLTEEVLQCIHVFLLHLSMAG